MFKYILGIKQPVRAQQGVKSKVFRINEPIRSTDGNRYLQHAVYDTIYGILFHMCRNAMFIYLAAPCIVL